MRDVSLSSKDIIKLSGVRPTGPANRYLKRDLLKLATWCANNLVLLQEDCPMCGQSAPEDCDHCEEHGMMQCECAQIHEEEDPPD